MYRYISILHGINVSGRKIIKMDDLRLLYNSLGLQNIVTYIQTGNVVFESSSKKKSKLKNTIETALQEKYDFSVHVEIRSDHEFSNIIKNFPYGKIGNAT